MQRYSSTSLAYQCPLFFLSNPLAVARWDFASPAHSGYTVCQNATSSVGGLHGERN